MSGMGRNGGRGGSGRSIKTAADLAFDNTGTFLQATNVQAAIEELQTVHHFQSVAPTGVQDGINTVYSIALPPSAANIVVDLNGQLQEEGVGCDFVLSESVPSAGIDTITFSVPLISTDAVEVRYTEF